MGDIAPSPGRVLWVVPECSVPLCAAMRGCCDAIRVLCRASICVFFVAVESGVDNLQSLAFDLLDAD
jgi:hypothetical protein